MLASRLLSRNTNFNLKKQLLNSTSISSNLLPDSSTNNKTTPLSFSALNTTGSRGFWFSSSASPEPAEKEATQPDESTSNDVESDLSTEDLVKLVAEKEEALKLKHNEIAKMNDKVLRTYADLENLMERTKREAENSKKFAVQNFAKSLLDVADNLGRASSVVKDGFSKVDTSKDSVGAVPLLKTLLEGVEMTDKQLLEVFRKFGLEKYDPINEQFDPNRHNAVFQVPDASKPAGTVASVLKPGYMLHDRVIQPAEVGVAKAPNSEENPSAAATE